MKITTKITVLIIGLLVLGAFVVSLDVANLSLAQQTEPAAQPADDAPDPLDAVENTLEAEWIEDIIIEGGTPFVTHSSLEEALATAVANGILTQTEADDLLADIMARNDVDPRRMFGASRLPGTHSGVVEIEIEGGPGGRGDIFGALHRAEAEALITHEDVRYLMETFADAAGDAVSVTFGNEGAGNESVAIFINGSPDALQETMKDVVSQAAVDGRITAAAAAAIEGYLAEMTTGFMVGQSGIIVENGRLHLEDGPFEFNEDIRELDGLIPGGVLIGPAIFDLVEIQLAEAVAEGRVGQSEAAALLTALREALSE